MFELMNYPEINQCKTKRTMTMKNNLIETGLEVLEMFALSNEEMITVRGGEDGGPGNGTIPNPIKI
jgi:hypothetical protein